MRDALTWIRTGLLATALAGGGPALAAPPAAPQTAPAGASTGVGAPTVPGSLLADPFVQAMNDLWGQIRDKCPLPAGRRYEIAIMGVPPDNIGFSGSQKDFIAMRLSAAAGLVLRDAVAANLAVVNDLGQMVAVMSTGERRTQVDDLVRRSDQRRNVAVFVFGSQTARGYRIGLNAVGSNGLACVQSTRPIDVPLDYIPEEVFAPDQLLSRAAEHILTRASGAGEQTVLMRSRQQDGTPASPAVAESLARSFNKGVPLARERLPSRQSPDTIVRAEPAPVTARADAWNADIVLNRNARGGTRLEVDLRAPAGGGQDSTAFQGLVQTDLLPAIAETELQVVAPPATTSAGSTARPAPGTTTNPNANTNANAATTERPATERPDPNSIVKANDVRRTTVRQIDLSLRPQRVRIELGGVDRRREFAIDVEQPFVVEVDLQEVQGARAPELTMLDERGTILPAASPPSRSRPLMKRWMLQPGRYSIWLQSGGADPVSFILRARGSVDSLPPEPAGQITTTAGDWSVGYRDAADGRTCFAISPAVSVEPRRWRMIDPFILFQMSSGSDKVHTRFDGTGDWVAPQEVLAEVDHEGGRRERLRLRQNPNDPILEAVEPCPSGNGLCLPEAMLYNLTLGSDVTLQGATRQKGVLATVTYSLRGYQAAMVSMATLCNQPALARNLIVRTLRNVVSNPNAVQ